jgi:hypothetical protein
MPSDLLNIPTMGTVGQRLWWRQIFAGLFATPQGFEQLFGPKRKTESDCAGEASVAKEGADAIHRLAEFHLDVVKLLATKIIL